VATSAQPYAARLDVDYADQLDRLTTLLRLLWIIPIGIIFSLITSTGNEDWQRDGGDPDRPTGSEQQWRDQQRPIYRHGPDDRVSDALPTLVVRLRP
jgi:hypothetical protein